MKITVDLPYHLVKRVKLKALHQRKTLKDAFADTIRDGLADQRSRARSPRAVMRLDRETGLLVICGPADAPGRKMSIDEALALEHELGA